MEPLPDLASLSNDDLDELLRRLSKEETKISYDRRILHGKLDILRSERRARMLGSKSGGQVPVEQLADILSQKVS